MKKGLALALALAFILLLAACNKDDTSTGQPQNESAAQSPSSAPTPTPTQAAGEPGGEEEQTPAPENTPQQATPEPTPEPQPAPVFEEGSPTALLKGKTVTLSIKTNVSSTVNVIISTRGDKLNTQTFYDYYNRGKALEGAVKKEKVYNVDSSGQSLSFEIEDTAQPYYAHLNAVENQTGTWQSSVKTIEIYNPAMLGPTLQAENPAKADGGALLTVKVTADMGGTVYAMVTSANATKPSADNIKNNTYAGTSHMVLSAALAKDGSAYAGTLNLTVASFEKGSYTLWLVAQNETGEKSGYSEVLGKDFSIG